MSAVQGDASAVDPFTLAVAEELRVQLVRKQVSGRELARQLHVSSQWISQRTRGIVPMDTKDMHAICEVMGVPLRELLDAAIARADSTAQGSAAIGSITGRLMTASSAEPVMTAQVHALTPRNRRVADLNGSSCEPVAQVEATVTRMSDARTGNNASAA